MWLEWARARWAADLAETASGDVPKPGGTQSPGVVAACPLPGCSAAAAGSAAQAWVYFKIISGFAVTSLQHGRKPRGVHGSCVVPALGVESGWGWGGSGAVAAGLVLWGSAGFRQRGGSIPAG